MRVIRRKTPLEYLFESEHQLKNVADNAKIPQEMPYVQLTGTADHPLRIIYPELIELAEMAGYLRHFLAERKVVALAEPLRQIAPNYPGAQIVLATESTYADVMRGGTPPAFDRTCRDEAYVLDVCGDSGNPVVSLIGKACAGVRAAVARLTCIVRNDGVSLRVARGQEAADPFIPLRLLMLGNAARRQAPFGSPFKDIDYETWTPERISAYPELFWQFGFNGVQVGEYRGYGVGMYHDPWGDAELARIRASILTFFTAARKRGLFTSLFQWGDCLFVEGASHSWNDPEEHQVIRRFIEDIVDAYGTVIDHFVIHVGDPGGCTRDGCDHYKTPQQITAAYLEAFRRVNPKVQASCSTWANPHFWFHSPRPLDMWNYYRSLADNIAGSKQYCTEADRSEYTPLFGVQEGVPAYGQVTYGLPVPDGAGFLDAAFMPPDVGIALNRVYNEDQAALVAASGRPVDIWGWYLGDMEMCNTYWFTMQSLEKMLGAYPDQARDQVRSHTLELTFHGWPQVINSYIGAQKLWNPRRPLEEIEREFCIAGFGPMNADAVLDLYHVCENGVLHPLPRPANFGTVEYNAHLARVIERAATIKIPNGWKPNFAFPVPVQKLVEMLVARARLLQALSVATYQVEQAKRAGASAAQIADIKAKAVKDLPYLPIDPLFKQDASIVRPLAHIDTFAEMIKQL